ncbi:MAG: NAD-binding protein [Treponema sp.]|nr:NAD-binding protein [Candidatus Treponema caballi]
MSKKSESAASLNKKRKRRRALFNPKTYLGFLIVVIILVCTYIIGTHELTSLSEVNEIGGWPDAIWQTIVAVSAAYYDYYMMTVPGRLAALALLLSGMVVFSFVTGKITSGFMNMLMQGNKGLKKLRGMKNHLIICGWRPGFDKILEAVIQANPDISPDEIVLVNEAPSEQIELLKEDIRFNEVSYVAGDFADAETLERACLKTAKRVLVISDHSKERSDMEVDSQTVLGVITMKNICPEVYIAAEIYDNKFEEHLKLAKCDEILMTQEYEHNLLATASSGMGYSNVIKSLISDDVGSGIMIGEIPETFFGKQYKELAALFENKTNRVLVGVLLESNETKLTPAEDWVIPKGAKSIMICANHS